MRLTVVTVASLIGGLLFAGYGVDQSPTLDPANYSPPRLPSGKPDLQGLWSNAVLTPLERAADLADKAFLTEEEARDYEAQRIATVNRDARPDDAAADILLAYNDFWWDSGSSGVRTRRTSLIVTRRTAEFRSLRIERSSASRHSGRRRPTGRKRKVSRRAASIMRPRVRRCCRGPTTITTSSCRPTRTC